MKNIFKGLGFGFLALALIVGVGAGSANATTTLGASTITLSDSTTIQSGVTSGTTLRSLVITPLSSVLTTSINQHSSVYIPGTFGVPAYRTYGLEVGFSRDAVAGTSAFDGVDTGLDLRVTNNIVNNAAYDIQGAYIKAKNNGGSAIDGVVGLLRGLNVEVASEEEATTSDIIGLEVAVQNDSSTATANAIGLKIRRAGSGAAGLFNDIMFQQGETIDNNTDGGLTSSGWIRPYIESTAPDAVDPTGPVEGSLAVDGGEQDCFATADGTDGGSLCVYSGSAWVVVKAW